MKDKKQIKSFFKVIKSFSCFEVGDYVYNNCYCHLESVKIATAKNKTVFTNKRALMTECVVPCTRDELRKLHPHLTKRMKYYSRDELEFILFEFCVNNGLGYSSRNYTTCLPASVFKSMPVPCD